MEDLKIYIDTLILEHWYSIHPPVREIEFKLKDKIETDDSMCREDKDGIVVEINGDLGNVVIGGRIGKVILTIDFRETSDILTEKEYGS